MQQPLDKIHTSAIPHPLMRRVCRLLVLVFCMVSGTCVSSLAQFSASVSANPVAVGDQFQITFALQGSGANFTAPTFTDFNLLGGPSQSTSMQFANGSVSQSISFTYILQATKEGTYTISPASIDLNGKRIQSNAIILTVVKQNAPAPQGAQRANQQGGAEQLVAGGKQVFVKPDVSKTNVYRGEGIVVTYKLYTRVTLVNYSISKLPSFNGFWSQDIAMAQQLEFHNENLDGIGYRVADIKKTVLFPQQSGTLTLDAMEGEVVARIQSKKQQQSRDPFDQFFNDPFSNNPFFNNTVQDVKVGLQSDAVKITVRELPPGAPASFNGAVGSFTMETTLDKKETRQHEAVTLKIKIAGKGNLKLIDLPVLNFPSDFESYDPKVNANLSATTTGVTGSKTFEYLFIPRNAGEYKIPVSGFSWFDPATNKYQSVNPAEFLLKVTKGVETSTTALSRVSKADIQFLGKDIRFIKTSMPSFARKNINLYNTPLFYSFILSPALLFAFLLVFRKRRKQLQSNVGLMKSRKANKVARNRLGAAKKFLSENKRELFLDEMFRALWGFVSDKLHIPVSELSKENVAHVLTNRNIAKDIIQLFIEALDTCELARFAPGVAASNQEIYEKGISVISKLEEEIR